MRSCVSQAPSQSPKQLPGAKSALSPKLFRPYVHHLSALLNTSTPQTNATWRADLISALDGQPGRELRKLYEIRSLRHTGTYFTGSRLPRRLLNSLKPSLRSAPLV